MEEHERENAVDNNAKMDANDLRGAGGRKVAKVDIPGVDTDSEEDGDGEGAKMKEGQWGRKARVRQRKMVKRAMEIHERNLAEKGNESDKDIEDLLED